MVGAFWKRADSSECRWKEHHFSHNYRENCVSPVGI